MSKHTPTPIFGGNTMKLRVKDRNGLELVVENPDRDITDYVRGRIHANIRHGIDDFIQEIVIALRNLEPGKMIKLKSKPLVVTLKKRLEPRNPKDD